MGEADDQGATLRVATVRCVASRSAVSASYIWTLLSQKNTLNRSSLQYNRTACVRHYPTRATAATPRRRPARARPRPRGLCLARPGVAVQGPLRAGGSAHGWGHVRMCAAWRMGCHRMRPDARLGHLPRRRRAARAALRKLTKQISSCVSYQCTTDRKELARSVLLLHSDHGPTILSN